MSSSPEVHDPYDPANLFAGGVGENVLSFDDDGTASVRKEEPDERLNTWKNSRKIQALPDSAITEYPPRPISGIIDYRIGDVSVSYRGEGHGAKCRYLCHTHVVNVCPHTKRIHRYRMDRAEEAAA
jgi:hypothetical protein